MKILFVRAFSQILKSVNKNSATKKWRSESGQSIILICMVLLSFIMFFGFAINTGLLIAAKISVQSAADAAAYAGAATQARQLNAISFLNYDMRRQYKKFLYRYNFMGNVAAAKFSTDPTGTTGNHYGYPKHWYATSDAASMQNVPIKVPVICIPMTGSSSDNDNCQMLNLPNTTKQYSSWFPNGGMTTVTQAMMQSSTNIQGMLAGQCQKSGAINYFVLMEWLFRGDTDQSTLNTTLSQMAGSIPDPNDQTAAISKIDHLVDGLGLYPRNIINYMRIDTLKKFLNASAVTVTKDDVASLEGNQTQAEMNERTIQAFKSALVNLNNDVLDHSTVTMTELQPNSQIDLKLVEASFNAYVQFMNAPNDPAADTYCVSSIIPFQAKNAPVGVVKISTNPVYYAVKVKATAKLLFLPKKDFPDGIELEAFASARPFGSRIGPAGLSANTFVESIQPNIPPGLNPAGDCNNQADTKCFVPNLSISSTDTFYSPAFLNALFQIGATPNPNGHGMTLKFQGMDNAVAPEPAEIGHYNVIPPPKSASDMALEFIPYATDTSSNIFRFYAPLFTGSGDPTTQISTMMDVVFPNAVTGTNPFGMDMSKVKADLLTHMNSYVTGSLTVGGGKSEHGETETFAALELPMVSQYSNPPTPIVPNPSFWLTQPNQVLSSWGPDYLNVDSSGSKKFQPRFGYSVKFVAMQDITQGTAAPDDDQQKVEH